MDWYPREIEPVIMKSYFKDNVGVVNTANVTLRLKDYPDNKFDVPREEGKLVVHLNKMWEEDNISEENFGELVTLINEYALHNRNEGISIGEENADDI